MNLSRVSFANFIFLVSLIIGPLVYANETNVSLMDLNPLKIEEIIIAPQESSSSETADNSPVTLRLKLELDPGFHAYLSQFQLKLAPSEVDSGWHLSEFQVRPTVKFTDPLSKKTKVGTEGIFTMESLLDRPKNLPEGEYDLNFELVYQACGSDFCLFPKSIPFRAKYQFGQATPKPQNANTFLAALDKGWVYALLFVFFAGILTSFTPCIFPMIPITMAVIGSRGASSRLQSVLVSIVYVLGIALTYAVLGVFAARSGALFGSYLGHPVAVSIIALIFIIMGLGMFGLFEIQMPTSLTNKLVGIQTRKNYFGAFVSGLIAGVIASPCVGPVLVGILTYVAQTQSTLKGFVLLFTFALGLGQIFLVLGTFQSLLQRLPKSGPWMDHVKKFFGVVMFAMAIYYLLPVWKGPVNEWLENIGVREPIESENYKKPAWEIYSDEALAKALSEGRPVIIDFNAEWCLACKELEVKTFSDPEILEEGQKFLWLTFDATNPSDELEVLRKRYQIAGLPHIVIYDQKGIAREDLTLTGFEPPKDFLKRLKSATTK